MKAHIFGNIALDEKILVPNFPSPGTSIFGQPHMNELGGKGANLAVVLSRCNITTRLIAPIGNDPRGNLLKAQIASENLAFDLIEFENVESDFSIIFTTPDGENSIVTSTQAAHSLSTKNVNTKLAEIERQDYVILQGNLDVECTKIIIEKSRQKNAIIAMNPSPVDPAFKSLFSSLDFIFLNEIEAENYTDLKGFDAAQNLLDQGCKNIVITLGSKGAIIANDKLMKLIPITTPISHVVDTTGAGDCFMAITLASCMKRNSRLDDRAIMAAIQGALITISNHGTQSAFPTNIQLTQILQE